jgi:hypothetical protein
MTEKTFTAATMKVKLTSKQTLSAKLTADALMTGKVSLMFKGDKGDKGDKGETGETIASAYCNPDGTMVLTMDSGRRVATNLQPLTDSMGYAESAKESAAAAAASQQAASGSESAAASSVSASAASASKAKTSETNAKTSETNAAGSESAAASSASAAASSASAAASSQSAAKASEANAKTSETNAAASASAAAASARTQQADWTETDSTFQSFIKNKPTNLLTTNTTQTITADKTFTGAVTMSTVKATTVNADTVNATSLTVTGSTSVPTANADNNSNTVANTAFVKTAIANIVNGAPSQLDTLQELSSALGNDANFSATVAKEIGEKLDKAGGTITGPILYDKTPNDGSELPNKSYVDAAINTLHDTIKTEMQTAMLDLFPVGTILETTNSANPSTYIGGAWEQLGAGLTTITAGTYKETHNGTEDTYVFTAGSSNFTRNGVSMTGEAEHVITEGESASVNYQILTSTNGFLNIGRTPNSVLISSSTRADANPGLFCDRDASYTGSDGVMAYYDTTLIRTKAGNKPHNTLQPLYGVYRFRRTM